MLTMDKIERRLSNLGKQLQKYFNLLARNDIEEDILDETDNIELDSVNKHLVDKSARPDLSPIYSRYIRRAGGLRN